MVKSCLMMIQRVRVTTHSYLINFHDISSTSTSPSYNPHSHPTGTLTMYTLYDVTFFLVGNVVARRTGMTTK